MKEYSGREIRIIVTPKAYESAVSELLWQERRYHFNALCLVPKYVNITTGEEIYNINKLLSYFRGKLLSGETPSIFCNSCLAGRIYELFDRIMISPTINTMLSPEDFLKLCRKPQYYLEQEMSNLYWKRAFGNPGRRSDSPCGRIGDIEVIFKHVASQEGLIERWNMMRKRINWNRIIFILTEQVIQPNIPIKVLKEFLHKNNTFMIMLQKSNMNLRMLFHSTIYFHWENSTK